MSVSGHVENHSRLQVGITETNVVPSGGFPDPRDPRWVNFLKFVSGHSITRDDREVDRESFSKGVADVTHQMK